jgi:hypothetical protein
MIVTFLEIVVVSVVGFILFYNLFLRLGRWQDRRWQ